MNTVVFSKKKKLASLGQILLCRLRPINNVWYQQFLDLPKNLLKAPPSIFSIVYMFGSQMS